MAKHRFFVIYLLPLVLVGFVLLTALAAVRPARSDPAQARVRLIPQVLELITAHYVESLDRAELSDSAIRGMVSHLDRYSQFLDAEATRAAEEDNRGRFGGLGVHLSLDRSLKHGFLTVARPFRSGPARAAGILPGDRIVAVDSERLARLRDSRDFQAVLQRIKGEVGSPVRLTLERTEDGATRELDCTLTRAQVQVETVLGSRRVDPEAGLGYFRIDAFKEHTVEEVDAALRGLMAEGLDGLVLDLRNNGGGLLRQAAEVADRFLPRGVIVSTRGRHPEDHEVLHATPAQQVPAELPLVVLINRATASAAEALAGALQDYRRAVILGERSYGKGVVQSVYRMGQTRTSLKITTSRYYTPSGRCIDRIYSADRKRYTGGILPDVVVLLRHAEDVVLMGEDGEWERWLADEVDPRTPAPPPVWPDTVDRQLLAAIDLLRGRYPVGRTVAREADEGAAVRARPPEAEEDS
ncbi:MAG: S41 family peptidase [Planctomycetes bacterium]|nr:S41 family peptidase [Planctomycetota bacterium]